ncbi:SDR family NAD(P)-dependent oxidoreductase [Bradyrhizobium sp. CCGUVB1N3]|uniref:SDR family NAD(P)-dependent oxidoreductase n=1 Tax=Bradyrhizobium sp. CCGUVB1N3 TaxID=2949629 RepID=UPI0020B1AF44|nr:SDR family NAD(P)-dependent oxidoreductase [Bradyrhizobium sp. CCGUVB1N3]MCP3468978.1 SDR family NAD(P)-dependent oxidoreductase [Bradyrhizobium sp. CCGUVB1N3]
MIDPIEPPRRKNPLLRTRLPASPPRPRSRTSHGFTRAAAEGRFMLQRCEGCGAFAYPAREACPACLSAGLAFVDAPRRGTLLAETTARVPSDVYFRERVPWRIGLVKMDVGPTMVAHLHADCSEGAPVLMSFQLDKSGQAVAFARPEGETPNMADDRQWREMTADPKFRRVLVTNGRSVVGQEAVAALKAAGAKTVFVGVAEPWRPFAGEKLLRGQEGIEVVTLDAADEKSATDLAADIGGKVDILVNTTEYVRPGGLLDRRGTSIARDEIDQAYLGFINLAQAFGPAMRMRGADGINNSVAWANILSVYALANWPAFGAYSASQAACLSLSHCLRAELRPGGIKVMNLFTGPVDTEWFQTVPPPKVAPRAVAQAIVSGLRGGLEEMYVGDVAEEIRQRLAANPKALERELDR